MRASPIIERGIMGQYKVLQATTPINERQLNELASEGWRLVTIIEWHGNFYFYFEMRAI